MPRSPRTLAPAVAALLVSLAVPQAAHAVGESDAQGFPSWAERVQHQLANRARVDPQLEMGECGAACAEAACYEAMPPLYYDRGLNRAARFHAAHQSINSYFAHTTPCDLAADIGTTYPATCDGAASCSCVGGSLSGGTTDFGERLSRFGAGATGEIIASGGSPESAFYLWLYEATDDPQCNFTQENGHRWLLLTNGSAVGFGSDGLYVGDFGSSGQVETHPIASGAHWPRGGATVEAWASWYADAAPASALVNVDGACTAMTLTRGVGTNGAYRAELSGLSGCSRYVFLFEDAAGELVTFPTTGSLGIGDEACAAWSDERPPTGPTCDCAPQCEAKQCGDDACGGSCGSCADGSSCDASGQCVGDVTAASGAGGGGPGVGGGEGVGASSGAGGDTSGPGAVAGSGGAGPTGSGSGSDATSGPGGGGGDADAAEGGDLTGGCGCTVVGHTVVGRTSAGRTALLLLVATASLAITRARWRSARKRSSLCSAS